MARQRIGESPLYGTKGLAVFLATFSTFSFASAPETEAPLAEPALPAPIEAVTPADPSEQVAVVESEPLALSDLETYTAPAPSPTDAANIATPVEAGAGPVNSAEPVVESFGLYGHAAPVTAEFAAKAVEAEAAPVNNAARDILAPLEAPQEKRWSGSVFAGYAWEEEPRIGGEDVGEDRGADNILQAGINLNYALIRDEHRQLTFAGGYNYDFYQENSDLNGDSVNASLIGLYSWGRTYLNASATWNRANGANRIVADEISSDTIGLNIGLAHELTGRLRATGGVNASYNSFDNFLGSETFGYSAGLDYAFSGKTRLGINYGGGITQQDDSEDQLSHSVNLTAQWDPTEKLDFNGSIGYETRSSDSEDFNSDGPGLIFAFGGNWQITPKTGISLSGSRSTLASPVQANSNIYTTNVNLAVNWKISQRFNWTTSTGYSWDEYEDSTGNADQPARDDTYWSVRNNLGIGLAGPWSLNVFHEYRNNSSEAENFDYSSNRVGANVSFNF